MRLSHDPLKISACFDDPNLVSRAGLVPVMALAERAGLHGLVRRRQQAVGAPGGALVLEHGDDQADAVRARLEAAGFTRVALTHDLGKHPRVTSGVLPDTIVT